VDDARRKPCARGGNARRKWLGVIVALATALALLASAGKAMNSIRGLGRSPAHSSAHNAVPGPLRGVPLVGRTGLKLLAADAPPVVIDIDRNTRSRVRGLRAISKPLVTLSAAGTNAVVRLDSGARQIGLPSANIYVIRRATSRAAELARAWEMGPSADGRAVWLKAYQTRSRCTLREMRLNGQLRRAPRRMDCASRLLHAGTETVISTGRSIIDPRNGRILSRRAGAWAKTRDLLLTSQPSRRRITLVDVKNGREWALTWPSNIGGADQAAVEPRGRLIALSFSDPAYEGSGTQVTDIWLLDVVTRRFQHLPNLPAAVSLKETSMAWTEDGRLVILGVSGGRGLVAVWRPGAERLAVRRIAVPPREIGSDAFVIW
jgi:hypothetical protein